MVLRPSTVGMAWVWDDELETGWFMGDASWPIISWGYPSNPADARPADRVYNRRPA
jgi:hypothetical protein